MKLRGDNCTIHGCPRAVTRGKICNSCANRKWKNKDYPIEVLLPKSLEERFLINVMKHDSGCWIWIAALTGSGYGAIENKGKYYSAHRLSWEIYHTKEIPKNMFVLHHCDNPACVNPEHLFLGTHRDNMKDKSAKGRAQGAHLGIEHPLSKLDDDKVREIKVLMSSGKQQVLIAKEYGVSTSTINGIKFNRTWRHVK